MKTENMQRMLREISGIRVGSHTADYVVQKMLATESPSPFFIMGGDARTGRPVRQKIDIGILNEKSKTM